MRTGRKECEHFKEECFVDPTKFDKAIKRRQIWNFSSDAVKVTHAGKEKTIQELPDTQVAKNYLEGYFIWLWTEEWISIWYSDIPSHRYLYAMLMGHVDGPCWWVHE